MLTPPTYLDYQPLFGKISPHSLGAQKHPGTFVTLGLG